MHCMNPLPEPGPPRVFFALWPTAPERDQLAAWLAPLQGVYGGRAMRPGTLHNTLVFVGSIATERLEQLQQAARQVNGSAFELCFDEARYWGHNRIVYAAPSQVPRRLLNLADALQRQLRRAGFEFDERAYQAHVTLLRNARRSEAPLSQLAPVSWQIGEFVLVQSELSGSGANYRVLARFPLKPAATAT